MITVVVNNTQESEVQLTNEEATQIVVELAPPPAVALQTISNTPAVVQVQTTVGVQGPQGPQGSLDPNAVVNGGIIF